MSRGLGEIQRAVLQTMLEGGLTVAALDALEAEPEIDPADAEELMEAYGFDREKAEGIVKESAWDQKIVKRDDYRARWIAFKVGDLSYTPSLLASVSRALRSLVKQGYVGVWTVRRIVVHIPNDLQQEPSSYSHVPGARTPIYALTPAGVAAAEALKDS